MKKQLCTGCVAWTPMQEGNVAGIGAGQGECRAGPPKLFLFQVPAQSGLAGAAGQLQKVNAWPVTDGNGFCYSGQPKPPSVQA